MIGQVEIQGPVTDDVPSANVCPSFAALLQTARPELRAQGLLILAEQDAGKNRRRNHDILEQAFGDARSGTSIVGLRPINPLMTARVGLLYFGQDLKVDDVSLQSRAAKDLAAYDWNEALQDYRDIDLKRLPTLSCKSEFTYDLSSYYETATGLLALYPSNGSDVLPVVLRDSLRPAGVPFAASLLAESKLSPSELEDYTQAFIQGVEGTTANSSEFLASREDLVLALTVVVGATHRLPTPQRIALSNALRAYVISNLDAPRCINTDFGVDLPLRSTVDLTADYAKKPYPGLADLNQVLVALDQVPVTVIEASPLSVLGVLNDTTSEDPEPAPIYGELHQLEQDFNSTTDKNMVNEVNSFLNDLSRPETQSSLTLPSMQTALILGQLLRLPKFADPVSVETVMSVYLRQLAEALTGTEADFVLLSDFITTDAKMTQFEKSKLTTHWRTAVCEQGNVDLQYLDAFATIRKKK